ncbi:hypothetical protein SARC_07606 [Sphaeroforma arctica JP610]|uniref:Uncharacterized protein n=1 Tax=Sphaeroforma arctica JP610 TaxID=667725 RepID=A0A0L0FTU7_9EUKA|nr:hypothetical protein SARC_07606 [Sphaeroforma arctica JP610]KNC80011.1 hypothetical protein SARC_07606 [Sphaeroforma arctica JP610]|eukprot:XP_014153913.1 hypothetical protein SARC_07606 [Sphaeroforma arctica JP610]
MSTEPLYSFWGTYSLVDKDLWHLAWVFTRTPFAYNPIASVCGSFNSDGRWHMTSQLKYDSDGVGAFLVHQVWRDHTHSALYASASRRQRRGERGTEAKKKKKKNREDTQTLENDGQGHAENGDVDGWKEESAADGGGYNGDEDAIARNVDVDGSIEDRGAAGVDVGSGVGIRVDTDPLQYPLEDPLDDPVANVLGSGTDGTIDHIEGNADSIDTKKSLVSDFEQMYNAPTVTIRYDLRERQRAGKPVDYKVNDKRFYNEFNANRLAGLKEDRNGDEAVFAENEISITAVEVVQAIEHAYRCWWLGSEDIDMGDNGEIEGSSNKQGGRSDTMSEF